MPRFHPWKAVCFAFAIVIVPASAHEHHHEALAAEMAAAANTMLESFNEEKQEAALRPFADSNREDFHYVPLTREGARYKDLTAVQRANVLKLLHTALSDQGSRKAVMIMALERVLGEIENNPELRDPELYWITIFGTPGELPWGWRFEGHHLSVNVTITSEGISGTPLFMGANPAQVPSGMLAGQRILGDSEDRARNLLLSLDEAQRRQAIFSSRAISEIETGQMSVVQPLDEEGISFAELNPEQQGMLEFLVRHYLKRHEDEISTATRARIEEEGWTELTFAWAGSPDPGEPHYYRIQGPTFVIEYANTQDGANHHHTVFRDFENDFGRDLLREHYRRKHR